MPVKGCALARAALLALLPVAAPAVLAQSASPPAGDSDFDSKLPPLGETATPAPPATTAPTSAPPADESQALQQPLAPLASFDATPPPPSPAEQAKGSEPRPIPYRVAVTGLDAIGLEGRFHDLSALVHDGKKAANAAQIDARANEDVKLAEQLMRAAGYYDGVATASIPPQAGDQPVPVTITAIPGNRYNFSSITITGLAPEPYAMARDALALQAGDPIVASNVLSGEAHISLRLPEHGYPFVKVGQRDISLNGTDFTGAYVLPVKSGPKSSFGGLRTAGDKVFGLHHLGVFPRFKRGDLYDSRKADDLRQALVATGMFSAVAVRPVDTGTKAPDGTETVDLLVRQVRGKVRTISASAGYGTGEGVTATAQWTHRNFFPPEGALILAGTGGTQQQSVSATFRRSDAGARDRTLQAGLTLSRQRFDAYNALTADLAASLARQSTPIWQKHWTYSIGAEITATRETPKDPADTTIPHTTYYLAALPLQGGYDGSNDLLNPTRGFRVKAVVTPIVQKAQGGGFDRYLSLLGETSGYWPIAGRDFVLAGRVRVGSIVGAARDAIAPSRRLYSGGGGSVRGYGYQQLGPKDADHNPIGGRSLTEFAVEARYRFGNYGVVPFFDGGRVGESSTPGISGMRYGVGIGARYYTNFGPFRLDVATPIGRRPGESKVAVYVSIGQAF